MSTGKKLFVEDLDTAGKRVIMRVDFNVPLKDGKVESDKRLKESLPTIEYLRKKGAKVILMSHLGRPDGKRVPDMSLRPVADALSALLGAPVAFADDCVGPAAEKAVAALQPGGVLLLENLRFHAEEEENDPAFAKQLASLADVYVNDAFGSAHRAHASTEGITKFVPQAASGYLMKKELDYLGDALGNPKRPFVAIIGGSKVSGKIDVIKNLLPRVDKLLIGGGMTYTFLKAQGLEIGKSIVENDKLDLARSLLADAGGKLVLGTDCVVTDKLDFKGRTVGRDQGRRQERHPRRLGSGRHRSRDRRRVHADDPGRQDHRLERPGRRVRDRRDRQGHDRRRRGAGQGDGRRRDHHHRRRRLGVGGEEGRRGEQGLARVDRRRRLARVPGGQGAPGRRGAHGSLSAADRSNSRRAIRSSESGRARKPRESWARAGPRLARVRRGHGIVPRPAACFRDRQAVRQAD